MNLSLRFSLDAAAEAWRKSVQRFPSSHSRVCCDCSSTCELLWFPRQFLKVYLSILNNQLSLLIDTEFSFLSGLHSRVVAPPKKDAWMWAHLICVSPFPQIVRTRRRCEWTVQPKHAAQYNWQAYCEIWAKLYFVNACRLHHFISYCFLYHSLGANKATVPPFPPKKIKSLDVHFMTFWGLNVDEYKTCDMILFKRPMYQHV